MAVLYRSHFQSIDVQMTLARMKVPFRITSGVGVFEQIHVKDTLAYLRLIVNPRDELSFLRLVCLFPGVGEKGAVKMWDKLGRQFDGSRREDREILHGLLGAKAKPLWPTLSRCFECAADHIAEDAIGELIEDFCDLFYEDHLGREWDEKDAEERLEDLKELAAQIASGEMSAASGGELLVTAQGEPMSPGRAKLEKFLADVALLTNLDAKKNNLDQDQVTLSTIHQAKGMEWPVVFVPWLSEGMFPSAKASEEGRMDEERRLFYVVVTRAKDQLCLLSPQMRRMTDGGIFPVEPSLFVKEIPLELVNVRRVSYVPESSGGYSNRAGYGGGFGGGYSNRGGHSGGSGYGGNRSGFDRTRRW